MDNSALVTIGNDLLRVVVDPPAGGRIAQITAGGIDLLVGFGGEHTGPLAWGSYPMTPWTGRIRRGQFRFDGTDYQLPVNLGDHAIHGVGFVSPWTVQRHTDTSVELHLALPADETWPFGGSTAQTIAVAGSTLRLELSITAGDQPLPASLGWHPWFRKPASIEVNPTAMYRRDEEGITVDELIEVPDHPWDDCFTMTDPPVIHIDGRRITLVSDCSDWVIYDETPHGTCIEPETAPPNSVNFRPTVLEPGATLAAWYEMRIE